ncbi:MAG: peptidoglycan DD-metalloendopeptidase family protein, partial [Polyangiaceae bacterium]
MKRRFLSAIVLGIAASSIAVAAPNDTRAHSHRTLAQATSPALALASLDRKIADFDAEEAASKKELLELDPQIARSHAESIIHGRWFYKLTRAGMLPVGGGFDQLVSHAMHVERARRALSSDLARENKLRQRGAELAQSLQRIDRDRAALGSQRTAMDAARMAMADEARRTQAFEKAFDPSSADFVSVGGDPMSDQPSASGFAASRGRLLFPVAGRADVQPAHREGIDGPAIEIHTALGATVRAVYTGRVAFADRYGSYGRIVILDHGDHYYSVSGNLASIDVHVGDDISAGEKIGTVGDEGQGSMLYFEVRHGADTIP